jgi:hypothetical protein
MAEGARPAGEGRGMSAKTWTADDVRALGARTDFTTACNVVGISRWTGATMRDAGKLPFPVLRLGRKQIVPVSALLKLLELSDSDAA